MDTIKELGRANFHAAEGPSGNELYLDAKPDTNDPTKFRQGTFDFGNYFGAFSGDFLEGPTDNPVRYEKVLVSLKPDDDSGNIGTNHSAGCLEVYLMPKDSTEDSDMVRVLRLTTKYIEFYGRKIATPDGFLCGGSGQNSPRFHHEGGAYVTIYQSDGNIVTYNKHSTTNEAQWSPIWASFDTK